MLILALESSCDETAAAVVRDGRAVLSSVVASQHELHEEYAGVVPEIASRAHLERILPVVRRAMTDAAARFTDLDAVAVGHRPGLIGSLLVGVAAARALAWALSRPIIGVDHVHAHLYAPFLTDGQADAPAPERADGLFPALGLVVSGGHTALFDCRDHLRAQRLGGTIDDAVGEAYDKAAALLGLPHPGGPALDRLARSGDDRAHDFPLSRLAPGSLDFSFSGLKTAVLYRVRGYPGQSPPPPPLTDRARADIAASFQRAAVGALILKLARAHDALAARGEPPRSLIVGGGVTANSRLRDELARFARERALPLLIPPLRYCTDNAAMIAGLAAHRLRAGLTDDLTLAAQPSSALA